MTTLYITRGLPGSGKSTWARKWVAEDPQHRAEVNRDYLRVMLHGREWTGNTYLEDQVTVAQHSSIRALLDRGIDVISSDTNLRQRYVRDLAKLAKQSRAEIEIIDMSDVALETCIERDKIRGERKERTVGEHAIRGMHRRYIAPLKGGNFSIPAEDETTGDSALVEADPSLHYVVICDIDGTVALKGARSPFDESRVHEDEPNEAVIDVVRSLSDDYDIVFMSGRTDVCRGATREWLEEHVHIRNAPLYMRAAGDFRKDSIVKRELFDKHIRGKFNVLAVLDDRDQVVKMWREELGLTCLQVAEGNF